MNELIKKVILDKGKVSLARCFVWNMLGSLLFAISTVLLTVFTTRVGGDSMGGDFAIALGTAQLMAFIGYYEIRTIQVTDLHEEFSFSDYFYHRLFTNLLLLVASFGFVISKNYSFERSFLVLLICFWKMLDTFADVYEGLFQKKGRLDISGKSLFIRTLLSTTIFIFVLLLTSNLYLSGFSAILTSLICIVFFNIMLKKEFDSSKLLFNKHKIYKLFINYFSLFAGTFMFSYISNSVRYSIDTILNTSFVTYFTAIFLPVYAINLVSGFIFKPLLTIFAEKWETDTAKEFTKLMLSFVVIIFIITLCALLGGYLVGIQILSLIYGLNLNIYRYDLMILLVGGGFGAFSTIEYYCLAVMRAQKKIFIGYFSTFCLSLIIPNLFVSNLGVRGATLCYLLLMVTIVIQFTLSIVICLKMKK